MQIKNYMENVVRQYVDEVMQKLDMCQCDKCRNDVMAIALNNLPPQYTVSREGALFKKVDFMEAQSDAKVVAELTNAAKIVMKDARHYDKKEI